MSHSSYFFSFFSSYFPIFVRMGMGEQTKQKRNRNPSSGTVSKIDLKYTGNFEKYKGKLLELAFSPAYGRLKSYSLKAAHQKGITMEAF